MSDERRHLLEGLHLPPNTSEHKYAGPSELLEAVDDAYDHFITITPTTDEDSTAPSPIIVFTLVPRSAFRHIYLSEKLPGTGDYIANLQTLTLRMHSEP